MLRRRAHVTKADILIAAILRFFGVGRACVVLHFGKTTSFPTQRLAHELTRLGDNASAPISSVVFAFRFIFVRTGQWLDQKPSISIPRELRSRIAMRPELRCLHS